MHARRVIALASAGLLLGACQPTDETRVIDAGTLLVHGHVITLHGVVAPSEANAKCDRERLAAQLAERRLEQIVKAGKVIDFRKTGMACLSFMSCDGFVNIDGVNLSDKLLTEGLVSPTEAPKDWCAGGT